jgi:hypothetical protein
MNNLSARVSPIFSSTPCSKSGACFNFFTNYTVPLASPSPRAPLLEAHQLDREFQNRVGGNQALRPVASAPLRP